MAIHAHENQDALDLIPFCNYSATSAPTVNDDSSAGYSVGSEWIDVTNKAAYECTDATVGAAVWEQLA